MSFETRQAAGRDLATALRPYVHGDAVVLGISRGGLVVAAEVAHALRVPLDVLVVHKIGAPGHTHTHLGVVAEPTHVVLTGCQGHAATDSAWLRRAVAHAVEDVHRRAGAYRGRRERRTLAGHQVIVVDDSAATGMTVRAAVQAARAAGAREIIVALPVAPTCVIEQIRPQVDRVVCLATPGHLIWHGLHYPSPGEIGDEEMSRLLEQETAAAM